MMYLDACRLKHSFAFGQWRLHFDTKHQESLVENFISRIRVLEKISEEKADYQNLISINNENATIETEANEEENDPTCIVFNHMSG